MNLSETLYTIPKLSDEKLIQIIDKNKSMINKNWFNFSSKEILEEYDLIRNKKSKLTKSQRDTICDLVSFCMIKMTKNND